MKYIKKYYTYVLCAVVFCFAAYILLSSQQDLLYAAQDMAVWRNDVTFFEYYLHKPFGLLQYSALFLTQFFYYPSLGILMLLALWLLSAVVSSIALNTVSKQDTSETPHARDGGALPSLCLLVSITQMGYWIYYLKLPSYWLLPTLLWLWWSIALLLTFRVRNMIARTAGLIIWICVLTPWNGFTIFLFDEPDTFFYISFYVMAAILVLQLVGRWILIPWWASAIVTVLLLVGSSMMNYRNACFHAELRMQQYAERADWKAVLDEMYDLRRKPTRQMVLMRDVALLHSGQLDNTSYGCEGIRPEMTHGPKVHMAFTAAPILFYSCGYINDAYRWTFENGVEYGISPRRLRMLLRCSLLNHEWELAERYIRFLRMTMFHSHFADEMEPLVCHPELFPTHPELMEADRYRQRNDELTPANQYCERILIQHPLSPLYKHSSWHFNGQQEIKLY